MQNKHFILFVFSIVCCICASSIVSAEIDFTNETQLKALTPADIQGITNEQVVNNYNALKNAGILNKLTETQALAVVDGVENYNLRDLGPTNALAVVRNKASSPGLKTLQIPDGNDRFFINGNQLNYGDVKTPIPEGFSGDIGYDAKEKAFVLKPDKRTKMQALKDGEAAQLEATPGATVEVDGVSISTGMTVSNEKGNQKFISADKQLKITKSRDGTK